MLLAQQLLFYRTAGALPTSSVAMGCPLPIQDFGFVFDKFSEVHVRPLPVCELPEWQLCLPAYTAAPSTDFMKMQASLVIWIIAKDAKGAGLAGTPLGVTPLITSHLKLFMATLWAQPSRPFSTHFLSTPPVHNFPGD